MDDELKPQMKEALEDSFKRLNIAFPSHTAKFWNIWGYTCAFLAVGGILAVFRPNPENNTTPLQMVVFTIIFAALSVLLLKRPISIRKKRTFYSSVLEGILENDTTFDNIAAELKTDCSKVSAAVQDMIDRDVLPKENFRVVDNGHNVVFVVSKEVRLMLAMQPLIEDNGYRSCDEIADAIHERPSVVIKLIKRMIDENRLEGCTFNEATRLIHYPNDPLVPQSHAPHVAQQPAPVAPPEPEALPEEEPHDNDDSKSGCVDI